MTRTLIDLDDALLERARRILGTSTKKDTVNSALEEVVALAARRAFLEDAYEGGLRDLTDPDLKARMWRR